MTNLPAMTDVQLRETLVRLQRLNIPVEAKIRIGLMLQEARKPDRLALQHQRPERRAAMTAITAAYRAQLGAVMERAISALATSDVFDRLVDEANEE